ncbi:MAG: hypothetical protein RR444_03690, partial [Oscillospiraceae bacterium]
NLFAIAGGLSHFQESAFYLFYQARQSTKPYTFGTPEILNREQVHSHRLDTQISPSQLELSGISG